MTRSEAVKVLASRWAGCHDAFGLLMALEEIGAVKFDPPAESAEKALLEAVQAKGFAYEAGRNLVDLVHEAGLELKFKGAV